MNNCRKCRSMFVEALYDQLDHIQKEWFETPKKYPRMNKETNAIAENKNHLFFSKYFSTRLSLFILII